MRDTAAADAVASERDGIEAVFVSDEACPTTSTSPRRWTRLSEAILAFNHRVQALQRQMAQGL